MEFSVIKIAGHAVAVLFTGSHYYFKSNFYGLICQAERTNAAGDTKNSVFTVRAGNDHTIGGRLTKSTIIAGAKRFINQSENKYISKHCIYNIDTEKDCTNMYLTVTAHEY